MAITPRKRINVTLYPKDEKLLINKFGKIPSTKEVLNYLLSNNLKENPKEKVTIERETLIDLKRIGNNINQIAHYANATKGNFPINNLHNSLKELDAIIEILRNDL